MKKVLVIICSLLSLIVLSSCSKWLTLDEKSYTVDSSCENIIIEEEVMNVTVKKDSSIGEIQVSYYEKEGTYFLVHEYSNVTKTYKVHRDQTNKKMNYNFSPNYETLVKVPESFNGIVTVKLSVGNIQIEDIKSTTLSATSSTGNISISSLDAEEVNIKSSAGNIKINHLSCSDIEIKSSVGNISMLNSTIEDELKIDTSVGEATCNNVKAAKMNAKGTAGNFKFENLNITTYLDAKTSTGNITIKLTGNKDNYRTTLVSEIGNASGDTTGGDISISAHTETGNIKVTYGE